MDGPNRVRQATRRVGEPPGLVVDHDTVRGWAKGSAFSFDVRICPMSNRLLPRRCGACFETFKHRCRSSRIRDILHGLAHQ